MQKIICAVLILCASNVQAVPPADKGTDLPANVNVLLAQAFGGSWGNRYVSSASTMGSSDDVRAALRQAAVAQQRS